MRGIKDVGMGTLFGLYDYRCGHVVDVGTA
jgi:hypothetical protein